MRYNCDMSNIKFRLYLLTILTILPFVFYTGYLHYLNINNLRTSTFDKLSAIATLTSSESKQIQEGARQLLVTLSSTPSIISPTNHSCENFLENVKSKYIRYLNLGIIDIDGQIICAADLPQANKNPPSDHLIKQTLESQMFSIGRYYGLNPTGGVINFAYPVSSTRLVYASVSLDWVTTFLNNIDINYDEFVVNIFDQNGTVLARSPDIIGASGKNFANDALVKEIISTKEGRITKTGIDQVLRLYSYMPLDDTQTIFVAVGIPQDLIDKSLRDSIISTLIIIIGISILSFVVVRKIGNVLIINQMIELQKIDKMKDEFVSLASHQLRSPMTAIRWLTESLLESSFHATKSERNILNKIHKTTLRLISLTSTLLNISRLESGTLTPHYEVIMVSNFIKQIISEKQSLLKIKKLTIDLKIKIGTIRCDSFLLGEVAHILLDNAIKYSDIGTTIKISVGKNKSSNFISVQNCGIGIDPHQAHNIFSKFYRSDNAKVIAPDGNGLGLYLAKLIASKLNGNLTFTSSPRHITIFRLIFPNEVS